MLNSSFYMMDCVFSNTKILSQCHAVCKLLTAKKLGVTLVKCLLSPMSRFMSRLSCRRTGVYRRCDGVTVNSVNVTI